MNQKKNSKDQARAIFYASTMDMTWRLALVFLIPFFVGLFLDNHFKTTPLWTLVGLVLGIGLSTTVVLQSFKKINHQLEKNDQIKHNQLKGSKEKN